MLLYLACIHLVFLSQNANMLLMVKKLSPHPQWWLCSSDPFPTWPNTQARGCLQGGTRSERVTEGSEKDIGGREKTKPNFKIIPNRSNLIWLSMRETETWYLYVVLCLVLS